MQGFALQTRQASGKFILTRNDQRKEQPEHLPSCLIFCVCVLHRRPL